MPHYAETIDPKNGKPIMEYQYAIFVQHESTKRQTVLRYVYVTSGEPPEIFGESPNPNSHNARPAYVREFLKNNSEDMCYDFSSRVFERGDLVHLPLEMLPAGYRKWYEYRVEIILNPRNPESEYPFSWTISRWHKDKWEPFCRSYAATYKQATEEAWQKYISLTW